MDEEATGPVGAPLGDEGIEIEGWDLTRAALIDHSS